MSDIISSISYTKSKTPLYNSDYEQRSEIPNSISAEKHVASDPKPEEALITVYCTDEEKETARLTGEMDIGKYSYMTGITDLNSGIEINENDAYQQLIELQKRVKMENGYLAYQDAINVAINGIQFK